MRHLIGLFTIALAVVGSDFAIAESPRPRHLKDRIGEFDAVVTGQLVRRRVVTVTEPIGPYRFVAVATVRIGQVFKGVGIATGAEIDIALARPTANEKIAKGHGDAIARSKMIWLLNADEPGLSPIRLRAEVWTAPANEADWDAYAAAFRDGAAKVKAFTSLSLEVAAPAQPMVPGSGAKFVLTLTAPATGAQLGEPLQWKQCVRFEAKPVLDGYSANSRAEKSDEQAFHLANVDPIGATELPANLPGDSVAKAEIEIRRAETPIRPLARMYLCSAQLVDARGEVLKQSNTILVELKAALEGESRKSAQADKP